MTALKLAIAIADKEALPSAFVVLRDFEKAIPLAATLGYDGVELALKRADEIKPDSLQQLLAENQVVVSCLTTGQIYAESGLSFTDADPQSRQKVRVIFRELIDLAAQFGQQVNIGRVRGGIGQRPVAEAEGLFIDLAQELCAYAAPKGVTMLLEPVNRYELDFINSVEEGAALMRKIGQPNMKLLPDVFHMNIEDIHIGEELARWVSDIGYVHLADSNRRAPGCGHTHFNDIFGHLKSASYQGWVSVEILPIPDPETAARQAITHLRPLLAAYNETNSQILTLFQDRL